MYAAKVLSLLSLPSLAASHCQRLLLCSVWRTGGDVDKVEPVESQGCTRKLSSSPHTSLPNSKVNCCWSRGPRGQRRSVPNPRASGLAATSPSPSRPFCALGLVR
ncbi:hypothetical protein F5Y17DRAFT_379784 [Xylariaceae sp. FL0594]|nr:hypothetical protein F5Y17DRAFT_379784 [Xylariaceae sp. FL0594]